ncbi:DUF2141 domain-containing protein [Sphingomonas crusticola]|uniref:DUF2141 domain-containing protein n=1 Tax=Sphingomonas crusticola TaxID=1697973 RepID=UPI000E2554C6|nr:DUF2141 domain-containing protein [Sphingomonas crusticola]
MLKFVPLVAGMIAATAPLAPVGANVLGPHAQDCTGGKPAMLVHVQGLKSRGGTIRVQSYGGDPASYFEKHAYLERVEVRVPATGAIDVCMPVPRPGLYAVSVRHDANGNGGADIRQDGGGFSGNPSISLFDAMFKRKPNPSQVQVRVAGLTKVPVTLNYVRGASVGPVGGGQ